ncbi:MAG: hypothetical protein MK345_04230 [SAR202 cluster bacterium]|nr:hypothetical protein [Gammaproteobacteria bacterium]MBI80362.1 hypothetical protein [Gammaproteobacteria bacterium]MCH2310248.1 hypothetical protein [SAR202 cluster bacterium]
MDYSELQPESIISENQYQFSEDFINKYTESVKDNSDYKNNVPPMAISALSIRGVLNDLNIPGGTVHVSQEFNYFSPVQKSDKIECLATIISNNVRGGWRFLGIKLETISENHKLIMTGKSTIMIPVENNHA